MDYKLNRMPTPTTNRQTVAHQLHKDVRKPRYYNKFKSPGLHANWQIDLCDVSRLKNYNYRMSFLLGAIDTYSKQAFIRPIRNKNAKTVAKAMQSILDNNVIPYQIMSDMGSEFVNSTFKRLMREYDIHHYTTKSVVRKAWIIERFWRTFLKSIHKYMTEFETKRYYKVLPLLLEQYNNRYHSTIKMSPNQVTYNTKLESSPRMKKRRKLNIGDDVRIALPKKHFTKGYAQTFSTETFQVSSVETWKDIPMYKITDVDGNLIRGSFYANELQKI